VFRHPLGANTAEINPGGGWGRASDPSARPNLTDRGEPCMTGNKQTVSIAIHAGALAASLIALIFSLSVIGSMELKLQGMRAQYAHVVCSTLARTP
jgi:hypothetical protein